MNNHEHLDERRQRESAQEHELDQQLEPVQFESELAEKQRRRLFYRKSGQLGPGTY